MSQTPVTFAKPQYRDAPDQSRTGMPPGVPYIIGNELAERFSFYGMKGILTIFMTSHLLNSAGDPAYMSEEKAKTVYHLFTAAAYFFPLVGAIISDVLWGKYKTILLISLMYCVGHGMLALMDVGPEFGWWDMKPFLFAGLLLIAIGAGGIKPCVSAHVGDQFGHGNKRLLTQVFNWFYFSINLGAFVSTMLTPVLLAEVGPWLAFGLPGILMGIATFVFWLGRHKFVHVPAAGWEKWKAETFSPEGKRALLNLSPLFLVFVPMFWMLFDQTGSAWVLQADKMDRDFGFVWLPSQIQAVNPLMILFGIPIFTYLVYPLMGKFFDPTPLRKIGIGLTLTAFAFVVSAVIERDMESKQDAIASTMYADMAAEAAQADFAPDPAADEPNAVALRWTRAAISAARVSGWSDAELAVWLGLAADTDEDVGALIGSRLEAKDALDQGRVVGLLDSMSAGQNGIYDSRALNGAVIGARTAGWDKKRIVQYLADMPNVIWQFLAYLILTSGEILVSIVCLEFAYTQSPRKMKSFIMGIYFLGVSLGNLYVSGVNGIMSLFRADDGSTPLEGANYYWFFAAVMSVTILVYLLWAKTYRGQTFIQGEEVTARAEAEAPDAR